MPQRIFAVSSQSITLFVIWLTDKNKERAKKYFDVLGVDPETLKDPGYNEYHLGLGIEGREVSFGTRDEEYNGKSSVREVWIGRKSHPNPSRSAARYFGAATDNGTPGLDTPF